MRKLLAAVLLIASSMGALLIAPNPAGALKAPMYTFQYDWISGCELRSTYGQYGNNAYAEFQQVRPIGSTCSPWSGITMWYHNGAQVVPAYCSILGEVYSPAPHCELLGPSMGVRVVARGALMGRVVHLCWGNQIYPPCSNREWTVF